MPRECSRLPRKMRRRPAALFVDAPPPHDFLRPRIYAPLAPMSISDAAYYADAILRRGDAAEAAAEFPLYFLEAEDAAAESFIDISPQTRRRHIFSSPRCRKMYLFHCRHACASRLDI